MQSSVSFQEVNRLTALDSFDILDTPRERDFDEVAQLASEICGTPIGVVNFIGDGRQFFKAEVGLGVRETPLDSSFCAKAILEEEFLVVADATKDPRFDCNPLVTGEPGLRFYAGALLRTGDGHAIGTVCVLDVVPHEMTGLQKKTLKVLARQVMKQLELRRLLKLKAEAELQQKILNEEIAHRLKNTLAIVQSIANQTLRDVADRAPVSAFHERLLALGYAHDVLFQQNWTSASLKAVTSLVLAMHDDGGRISIDGPDVQLGPKSTLSVSLVLHELATNAIKYGALSNRDGRIDLSWKLETNGGTDLRLVWQEVGGPTVLAPVGRGFGSRLIGMGVVGTGGADVQYNPAGLRAEFVAPLAEVQAASALN